MAQLGARLNGIEKVVGSSPTRSTGLMRELAERLALLVRKKIHHREELCEFCGKKIIKSQGKSSRSSCQRDERKCESLSKCLAGTRQTELACYLVKRDCISE